VEKDTKDIETRLLDIENAMNDLNNAVKWTRSRILEISENVTKLEEKYLP